VNPRPTLGFVSENLDKPSEDDLRAIAQANAEAFCSLREATDRLRSIVELEALKEQTTAPTNPSHGAESPK